MHDVNPSHSATTAFKVKKGTLHNEEPKICARDGKNYEHSLNVSPPKTLPNTDLPVSGPSTTVSSGPAQNRETDAIRNYKQTN